MNTDIDLTTIIISLIAISFFIIPIVYDQVKNKKNSQEKEEK